MSPPRGLLIAIKKNDWDKIAKWDLTTGSVDTVTEYLRRAIVNGNIALIRLFAKYQREENIDVSRNIAPESMYVMHRLGYRFDIKFLRTGLFIHYNNTRHIDWLMKHCDPPPSEEFFIWLYLESLETGIQPRILRHLIYRSFLQRYLDEDTIQDMKIVLREGLDDLPKELIHEVCLYLFICSPPL